ncbi:MAG TPA: hypothetical protein DHV07_05910 [Flavobacteriales bacterium]|nr:hypothetical protein [Flavobacteriales bacterium]
MREMKNMTGHFLSVQGGMSPAWMFRVGCMQKGTRRQKTTLMRMALPLPSNALRLLRFTFWTSFAH